MLALLLASAALTSAHAQTVPEGQASCRRCSLSMAHVARLGAESDSTEPDRTFWLSRRRDGSFLVAPARGRGELIFYDRRGRFVRTFGRSGPGPGELGALMGALEGPGDSIFVFEAFPRRLSVFTSDLQFARSVTLPAYPMDYPVFLDAGRFVFHQFIRTSELLGVPMHLVGPEGSLVASFGGGRGDFTPETRVRHRRVLGRGIDGTVWVGHQARYRLEQYSPDGRLLHYVERHAPSFEPWTGRFEEPSVARPQPHMLAVWPVDRSHVMVVIRLADRRWRATAERSSSRIENLRDPGFAPWNQYARYYDTVLQIIRVVDGAVVASRRLDGAFFAAETPGLLYTQRETDAGIRVLDIWELDAFDQEELR